MPNSIKVALVTIAISITMVGMLRWHARIQIASTHQVAKSFPQSER